MISSALYQDLVNDFKKQNELIDDQVATFEPIIQSLRMPAAHRLLNKGFLILLELLSYIIFLASIAFVIMQKHLVPFYIVNILQERGSESGFSTNDVTILNWSISGMALIIGVLFLIIARLLRKIRLKNSVLHTINKNIRILVAQHLQRKAVIETIEKRHFTELPTLNEEKIAVLPTTNQEAATTNPLHNESLQ